MTRPPNPLSLAVGLTTFAIGTANYAVQAPGGWDLWYWLAVATIAASSIGIAVWACRAVMWLKEKP
jgi:hypothetical protein